MSRKYEIPPAKGLSGDPGIKVTGDARYINHTSHPQCVKLDGNRCPYPDLECENCTVSTDGKMVGVQSASPNLLEVQELTPDAEMVRLYLYGPKTSLTQSQIERVEKVLKFDPRFSLLFKQPQA